MERSSKHGFRLDDHLSADSEPIVRSGREPRVEDFREMEPAGDDQIVPDTVIRGGLHGADPYPEVGHEELAERSEIARHLRKSVWPANRQLLVAVAREENAPQPVLDQLERLPDGREFENVQDVWHALGHEGETHRF